VDKKNIIENGSMKYDCPFKLWGKLVNDGEWWILELLCRSNNHELTITLLGHPYVDRLTNDKKIMLVDMIKTSVKLIYNLLTLNERKKKNVTIKQVYNVMNIYRIIEWYWCRFNENTNIV